MTQEPVPWLFLYSTITHLCQELSPCNNLEFSLGFILTHSSQGKWFTASAEAASEEEMSVRAVLWWVWHADFPAHLPAWRTDSPSVCSPKPSLLQSHCSTAKVVYKSWDNTAIAECVFMDLDLGFLEVYKYVCFCSLLVSSFTRHDI